MITSSTVHDARAKLACCSLTRNIISSFPRIEVQLVLSTPVPTVSEVLLPNQKAEKLHIYGAQLAGVKIHLASIPVAFVRRKIISTSLQKIIKYNKRYKAIENP